MPFVPTDLASCQEWHDVELSTRYTTSGMTAGANATYDPVGALTDRSILSAHVLQPTEAFRPQAILDGANKYLYFDGNSKKLVSSVGVTRGPFTVCALIRTRGSLGIMFHRGSALLASNEEWFTNGTTSSVIITRSSALVSCLLPTALTDNTWKILTIRFDGTTASYRINGSAVTLSSSAAAIGTGTFTSVISVGSATDGQYPIDMDFMSKVAFNTALSDSDAALVEGYFNDRFHIFGFTSDYNIVCDGNSWVRGYNARLGGSLLERTSDSLGLFYGPLGNYGVDGQTIDQMAADAAAQIDVLIDPAKTNILFFVEVYNQCDVAHGNSTGEYTYSAMAAYAAARRLAGWDVVIAGTPPITSNARCNTCSVLMRADTTSWDGLVDANADASVLVDGDGLHPGNVGYGNWAALLSTKILSLIPTPPTPSGSSFTDGLLHLGPHRRSTFLPYATQSRFD